MNNNYYILYNNNMQSLKYRFYIQKFIKTRFRIKALASYNLCAEFCSICVHVSRGTNAPGHQ